MCDVPFITAKCVRFAIVAQKSCPDGVVTLSKAAQMLND
jgi:hypothetical protein